MFYWASIMSLEFNRWRVCQRGILALQAEYSRRMFDGDSSEVSIANTEDRRPKRPKATRPHVESNLRVSRDDATQEGSLVWMSPEPLERKLGSITKC